ncbi:hypothetical protein L218DRAFT_831381, partial [Marasmius fiardii PR-910]
LKAYNDLVNALIGFGDGCMIIASLYIIGPARRARISVARSWRDDEGENGSLKGTGGPDLMKFLKGVRDRTSNTLL